MLKSIIYLIITVPLLKLVFRYVDKNDAKEENPGKLYFSNNYFKLCQGSAVFVIAVGIFVGTYFGWSETIGIAIVILVVAMFAEICAFIFKKYEIRIEKDRLVKRNLCTKRKIYFADIAYAKEDRWGNFYLFKSNNKKLYTVSYELIGIQNMRKLLASHNIRIEEYLKEK